MDPETIHTMHDGLSRAVLMLIQGITLGIGLASALFLLCGLAGAVLDSFAHWRRAARRQPARAPEPPEPNEYDLLVPGLYIAEELANHRFRISGGMIGVKDGRADSITGGVVRASARTKTVITSRCLWAAGLRSDKAIKN